jgi:hypothetical protein
VDRLEQALADHGFEIFVDRRAIADFEIWWERIEALITRADIVIFVLSSDAISSEVALREWRLQEVSISASHRLSAAL